MWNGIAELANIRRQELLAEASAERLARATRTVRADGMTPSADVLPAKRRRLSETVVR